MPSIQEAIKYVRLLAEIEPLMDKMNRTLNDLRQRGLELVDLWQKYHDAVSSARNARAPIPRVALPPQ